MYKCPECGSTTIQTERRPDGNSKCMACFHQAPTSTFLKVEAESAPQENRSKQPERTFLKMNWAEHPMEMLKKGDFFRILPASEADKVHINPEKIYRADSDFHLGRDLVGTLKCTHQLLVDAPENVVTDSDTPPGLYKKYNISKTDGKPIPPEDRFIVLRYNRSEKWDALCRSVLLRLAREIEHNADEYPELQTFSKELKDDLAKYRLEAAKP